ncbi:hypothetical protein FRC06_009968 [Ceratobasidium sp. 370]|nr:hypothetical protein FRC06_009968 [Ceratobasidium sp. 370]
MREISQLMVGASTLLGATAQLAQLDSIPGLPTPAQLASALASGPPSRLYPRVPLSTNDNTSIPLHDVQLLHPPPVPKGRHCTVELLKHEFGQGSYDTPAVVPYSPPSGKECGVVGHWGSVVGNLTVYSNGTQYDRLSSVYLDHVEIWRHSSAEPTKTGTVWTALKDLTPYTALLAKNGTLLMDFSNIISADLGLDGVFYVSLTATFYSGAAPSIDVPPSEVVLPLSNLSPNHSNYFSISDSAVGGVTSVSVPENAVRAVVEVYCSGNGAEEFWYLNTPDEIVAYFSPDAGLAAKGPFREVQVLVDGKLAGVVWPFPVIYTGGITPTNWRPLTSYGAYNQPTYFVDVTPFLPTLTDSAAHNITLTVVGQGLSPPHSINSNWFVSGNVRLTLGSSGMRTTGTIKSYAADPYVSPSVKGSAGPGNKTIYASVDAGRKLRIESELIVGGKEKRSVVFEQDLKYENEQKYVDDGWVQPLIILLPLPGAYGSAINQTFIRALLPPSGHTHSLLWTSRAQGWVGMDDAPGLRHAINGTGETVQSFGYGDVGGETYLRKSHAKNDGWVEDVVWGSLASMNPPVNDTSPGGGAGFRRRDFGGRSLGWEERDVDGPATDKRETLLALAKMTNNAYFHKDEPGWYDLGGNWTADHNIGWDPEVDGFRGHVFLSVDNSTAILSIKGTSAGIFGGATTIRKDKLNDNLLFSCCCARVDWTWNTVCGCYGGGNKCDQNCLEESLAEESLFYHVGIGVCTGPSSLCYVGGYALETKCHLGQTIVYDTVTALHWSVNIKAHFITTITEQLLNEDWSEKVRKGRRWWWRVPPDNGKRIEVPEPTEDEDCTECYTWEFGDYMNKSIGR